MRRDAIIDRLRGGDAGVLCSLDRALLSVQAGVAVPCEFVRYSGGYRRGCEQEAELLTRGDQVVVRGPAGEDPSVRAWWDGDGLRGGGDASPQPTTRPRAAGFIVRINGSAPLLHRLQPTANAHVVH